MATWPDIVAPSGLNEEKIKSQIKNDFESGYVSSRAKWTRSRKKFELSWDAMSSTDKATLETFFDTNLGDTFTWTHPSENAEYTVRFSEDTINADYKKGSIGYWQVSLVLEEA
jgi:hypothetical protein